MRSLDLDWMRECAQVAGIDDEIMAMPMNYNTLIGDMGTTLSGGQRQRVLLARALYRQPRILFMDEGTSNLDLDKEREVNRALAELKITRIVIAHRPETIRAADRIVVLREGRVSPPMDGEPLPSPRRRGTRSGYEHSRRDHDDRALVPGIPARLRVRKRSGRG